MGLGSGPGSDEPGFFYFSPEKIPDFSDYARSKKFKFAGSVFEIHQSVFLVRCFLPNLDV
jgi:hypothetical protein